MEIKILKELIEKGEGIEVELKRSFHSFQEIAKTICAFANTQGGVLILGVNNKKEAEGIDDNLDDIQIKIANANSTVHPKPMIKIDIQKIGEKNIAIIIVHKADSSMFHSFDGAIYMRIGSTTQKLEGGSILE